MQPLEIGIERLKVRMSVGIYAAEKKKQQEVFVSVVLRFAEAAVDKDAMQYSVDYDRLSAEIRAVASARHYELIENLAYHTGAALKNLARAESVSVRIDKPLAAKKNRAETIWVNVTV